MSDVYLCTLGAAVDVARQRATLTGRRHRVTLGFPGQRLHLRAERQARGFNYYRIQEAS